MISVFDMFKIGIGPSSSHTVGPMVASGRFLALLDERLNGDFSQITRIHIELYGSLSATGKGHATDTATLLGLLGHAPRTIDTERTDEYLRPIYEDKKMSVGGRHVIDFDENTDIFWYGDITLPQHPNGMVLIALLKNGERISETYFSIGGGFVVNNEEFKVQGEPRPDEPQTSPYPYPFELGADIERLCHTHDLTISELMWQNETAIRDEHEVREYLNDIWATMQKCVNAGYQKSGILPGGLNVKRRAKALYDQLSKEYSKADGGLLAMDWVNLYALAVNEENASGGRVVTAPTNGAAGIIPAVLHYYQGFIPSFSYQGVREFLLVAGAIGALIKQNASISGAEVGCQGEVGSACAMAAAGLAHVLGGSVAQCLNAAEIGLEHNLGLTCDPIGGLVQVPCIERNAMASVKAINAARLALRGDGSHHVSLDKAILTMKETGMDMMDKYKETARGGLAIHADNRIPVAVIGAGFSQC